MSPMATQADFESRFAVKLVPKDESALFYLLGKIYKPMLQDFWTTIGTTIYYPTRVKNPMVYQNTLRHELVHVRQWRLYSLWFWFSYAFLPLPIGFAYCRWVWEREAYMRANIKSRVDAEIVLDVLCGPGYLWPWPKAWARKWFYAEIEKRYPYSK